MYLFLFLCILLLLFNPHFVFLFVILLSLIIVLNLFPIPKPLQSIHTASTFFFIDKNIVVKSIHSSTTIFLSFFILLYIVFHMTKFYIFLFYSFSHSLPCCSSQYWQLYKPFFLSVRTKT